MQGFKVGSGRANRAWPSNRAFVADDSRRDGGDQCDYGVHWYDRRRPGHHRLTYIEDTGEVIAVQRPPPEGGIVELLAVIPTDAEVERRLEDWAHAAFGSHSLAWVRRRLAGWRVPLPPRAQWWLEEDSKPPEPYPAPPPPTVHEHDVGAYVGAWDHGGGEVQIVLANEARPLYHYVGHSPTGFSWGYSGAGPTDLAQSILADRLGYVPSSHVTHRFRNEVVAALDQADFVLTFDEVNAWVDSHRVLFAHEPRAGEYERYDR